MIRPLRPYVMPDEPPVVPAAVPVTPEPAPEPAPRSPAPAGTPSAAVPPLPEPPSTRSSLAVRPFLLTAGRVAGAGSADGGDATRPALPLETQVVATSGGLAALTGLTFEHHAIVDACRVPQSLAELAARLRLHLNVVRVIADDLRTAGQLAVYAPQASTAQDVSVLRRVIDGLRAVPDSRGLPRDNRPA
jgi:hypothetical protein